MTTPKNNKSLPALALKQESSPISHYPGPLTGERLISRAELRQFIDISDMSLWRWLRAGKFPPPVYIGARRFWKATAIAHWLDCKQSTEVHNGGTS
jgi:predicted DNA-binding transcriptional regulator AlpA